LTAICIKPRGERHLTMAAPLASSPVRSASRRRCRRRSPARRHHPGARPPRSRLSAAGDEGQTRVGGQVQELEVPATKTTRKYNLDATRTTDLLPGQHRTGSRQEPTGCPLRRHPADKAAHRDPHRSQPVMASSKRNELIHRLSPSAARSAQPGQTWKFPTPQARRPHQAICRQSHEGIHA
jgi:hypothetical protein